MIVELSAIVLIFSVAGNCYEDESNEYYNIVELLEEFESPTTYESKEENNTAETSNKDEELLLSDGLWKCGKCDAIDDSKLLYSEENDVSQYNVDTEVQVSLVLDGMDCITVSTEESRDVQVRRVAGSCAGPMINLAVNNVSARFTIRAYKS